MKRKSKVLLRQSKAESNSCVRRNTFPRRGVAKHIRPWSTNELHAASTVKPFPKPVKARKALAGFLLLNPKAETLETAQGHLHPFKKGAMVFVRC